MSEELEESPFDPLFVGLTRPTMIAGVTFEVFIINGMLTAILFLGVGNPLYLLSALPLHLVAYAVCLKEPRAFTLFMLSVQVASKCPNRMFWKATSYSPLTRKR